MTKAELENKKLSELHALASAVHLEAGENQIFRAKRIQDTFARVFPAEKPPERGIFGARVGQDELEVRQREVAFGGAHVEQLVHS